MSFLDTIIVNGYDVRALAGIKVVGTIEHWAPGDRRGDDEVIPGRDGVLSTQLPRDTFIIRIPIQVTGATRAERNDNLRNAIGLMRGTNHGLVTVRRRIATGSADAYTEYSARGRWITAATSIDNHLTGTGDFQILNLDGAWKDSGGVFHVP